MTSQIIHKYNPKLKERARELRSNMTDAEIKLWQYLRNKQIAGIKFLRQRPIGNYLVDFYATEISLVIEVDGGQHFQNEGKEYDSVRDDYLKGLGLTVIRFSNSEVLKNIQGVLDEILRIVDDKVK